MSLQLGASGIQTPTLRMGGCVSPSSKPEEEHLRSPEDDEPSQLELLPLEVFEEITEHLSYAEINQLRQTSRTMLRMTAGTRKWKALGHFRANYTKCLFAADLFSCQYSALEFCAFELLGKEEGSTCPKCRYKRDILQYLLHRIHVPTQRGRAFDHLAKTLRREQDLPNGSYKVVPKAEASRVVNTCERDWFGSPTRVTPVTSLPLATAIVVDTIGNLLSMRI